MSLAGFWKLAKIGVQKFMYFFCTWILRLKIRKEFADVLRKEKKLNEFFLIFPIISFAKKVQKIKFA